MGICNIAERDVNEGERAVHGSGFMAHDFNLNVDVNLNKMAHRNHR